MSGFLYAKLKCTATAERGKIIKCSKIKKCRGKVKRFKAKSKGIGAKCNCIALGYYLDEGISGTQTKKRTEFNRMIRMCKNKKIDLVITKSISRFARNTVDCLEYVRQLKDLGIGVIFEKENINTLTMTSEFMISLYGSFAQAESESISKNVSWGKEKAYREGKVQFQYKHLLGYKKGADGKPEIIPEEAETVKLRV